MNDLKRHPERTQSHLLAALGLAAIALIAYAVHSPSVFVEPAWPGAEWTAPEPLPSGIRKGKSAGLYVYDSKMGLEIDMIYVPPGDFVMGTDDADALPFFHLPKHTHAMARGYFIGRNHITVGQFAIFAQSQPGGFKTEAEKAGVGWVFDPETGWVKKAGFSWRNPGFSQGKSHPVVFMAWTDARAFCEWAGLRLPNEAEWEKAARGEHGRRYPWGDAWDSTRANCNERSTSTSPVGSFPNGASPYGALDMAGNVWQWCLDEFDSKSDTLHVDPGAWTSSSAPHSGRGGCWFNQPQACRTYHRSWERSEAGYTVRHVGFRTLKPID